MFSKYFLPLFCFILIISSANVPVQAQNSSGPSSVTINKIVAYSSQAGKMLASYHAALEKARRVIAQKSNSEKIPELYAGGPYDDGWAFSFGKLEQDGVFVIDFGVILDGSNNVLNFEAFDKRREASRYHTLAAKALVLVKNEFEGTEGFNAAAYRFAVLPFPNKHFSVFVSPEQTQPGVTLFGNTKRYTISREENKITNDLRFHHSVIKIPHKMPENAIGAALMVPDAPIPSPVDVMNTIDRGSPVTVLTQNGVFEIQPTGAIKKLPDDDPTAKVLIEANKN